jgi:hypothetical protein
LSHVSCYLCFGTLEYSRGHKLKNLSVTKIRGYY